MYRITRLQNGLTVITAEMPHMASVSVGLWVGIGGRYEPKELNGAAHFIEHLLFKGTGRRSAKEISQAVEGIGGYLNAFTEEENTCFYARAGGGHFERLLEVLLDMFLDSTFDHGEMEKERDVIKEELAMYLDQPHQHVQELLSETMWPDHPLGRSLTGTVPTIEALRRTDLIKYQRRNYLAANSVIAVAGHVRHEQVVQAATRLTRHFPSGPRPQCLPAVNDQRAPRLRLFPKETAQTQIALGLRLCSRHDESRYAVRVLNAVLGENMSSRLFQVLREDHGLAYSIHSSLSFFDDTGALVISAGLEGDKLRQALRLIRQELRRCVATPPTARELREARDYLIGQFDLSLEGTENQMMWVGEQWLAYGKIDSAAEVKRRLHEVTAAQVRQVAREFFRPERVSLAVVSPLKSNRGLGALLEI